MMGGTHSRRAVLAGLAAAGTSGVAGCLGDSGAREPISVSESWESGLGAWSTHGSVGADARGEFDWAIDVTDERAADGSRSLRVFTEGRHDDGTAWVTRSVPVERETAYDATASVRAWSAGESFNTVRHLVMRLGPDQPTSEGDFPSPGENSTGAGTVAVGGLREPMDREGGWEQFGFEFSTPTLATDALALSVGVSVVWETDRTDYLDDVRVSLEPRS
jgi:hypothetical protein